MYYVYFIQSLRNSKIYVGHTSKSPFSRLKEHNNNSNQWSKNNKPFRLVYYEGYECKNDAERREKFYKMGFGKNIKDLIVDYLKSKKIKPDFDKIE
jgi:putative endonuclease